MADQLRDQINTARRAGYTDDELIGYLKEKDPRITEALSQGHKAKDIMEYLAPVLSTGEELMRKAGVAVRGASEALAPVATGAGAGFLMGGPVGAGVGALAGGLAAPVSDVLVQGYNRLMGTKQPTPSQAISNMLPGPRAETPVERVVQAGAGALGGTAGSVAAGNVLAQTPGIRQGLTAIGQEAARRPVGQIVTAPISAGVGQGVTEATDSPLAGLVAGVATGTAAGLRPVKRTVAPTAEELLKQSKANYDILDKSGFQLDTTQFKQHMGTLSAKLRSDVGYVESVNPKVAGAIRELTSDAPKDIAEITALRKIIGGAAGSSDRTERMTAMRLLDEFDDYVLNAPPSAIISGDPKAMDAWKAARADYAKVKKSELITNILEDAELARGKKEGSIASQLGSLAKSDKKMRFFTNEEQQAIREAAKGGTVQSALNIIAKFSPSTPAAAIFTAVNPFGAYTAAAGMAAEGLSNVRRTQQANALANRLRLGEAPKVIEGAAANLPVFYSRAMINNLNQQQPANALAQ